MQIRISQSKGKKDRYSILAPNVLKLLRNYVKEYQPNTYLFEGQSGGKYSNASVHTFIRQWYGYSFYTRAAWTSTYFNHSNIHPCNYAKYERGEKPHRAYYSLIE